MYLYACLYKKRMQFPDVEIIAYIIPVKNELSESGNLGIQWKFGKTKLIRSLRSHFATPTHELFKGNQTQESS